jgi:CRP/FNR family transcriptional regulator, cyclic AMP receptor protein
MSLPEAALWTPPTALKDPEPDALEALKAVPLFAELRPAELKKVLRIMHQRAYQAGEVIFREGEPGAGMYVIKRGAVDIVIKTPDGAEKVLAQLADRQFFGEMALLDDAPRSATAVSTQRTELLGFFVPDLEELLERDARLGSRVLLHLGRLMAGRLRAMNEMVRAHRSAAPEPE